MKWHRTNHLITYIYSYLYNFGPLPRFGSGRLVEVGSDTTCQTRFGVPVREMCSKQRFGTPPDASLPAALPHIDLVTLTKLITVWMPSLQTLQNSGFSNAAAIQHHARESLNAHGPAASGALKTRICFSLVAQTTYTQNRQACFLENGLQTEHMFANGCFTTVRVASSESKLQFEH